MGRASKQSRQESMISKGQSSVRKYLTQDMQMRGPGQEQQSEQKQTVYYKSFAQFINIAIILSISSFQFGYALCEISTVPITQLIDIFGLNIGPGLANGILVGIMPVGGILGSAINPLFVKYLTRKKIHYVISAINVVSTVLQQITNVQTILIGRFLLGVCCGIYTMIAPQFIQELSPPSLRTLLGSFFSMGRIIGIIFCYTIGLIFELTKTPSYWRIMFIVPGVLAVLQSILIFIFVTDTPVQLVQRGQYDQLQKVVRKFYKQRWVQTVILEYKTQNQLQRKRSETKDSLQKTGGDPLAGNKKRAFYMALHLHNYRQLLGVNTVVAFGGVMVQSVNAGLALYANLLLNGAQGIVTIPATFWIGRRVGRRPLYLWSGVAMALCAYLVAIGYLVNSNDLIIAFMFLYMISFGLIFSPVSWSYPAQIVTAKQSSIGNVFTWISMALTTVIPPIIIHQMNGNAWTVFMFFGVYITLSLIYMYKSLVETKQKKYQEFITEF